MSRAVEPPPRPNSYLPHDRRSLPLDVNLHLVSSMAQFIEGVSGLENFPTLPESQVHGLFNDIDVNHDGRVTLQEFTVAIANYMVSW